ncbi:putative acetyltransferase [Xenorhabdus poinarii G6]|uniref:Putative acetyltransferase n=1 Tax=Xenorhabdus poinarii G6 TaxID=1354304 RepID=A0A068R288_9GAMM|nr:N-acetyltransferase [Xenorhabdus poinarii]CDG21397.1 putative acetyltransferase [Xenorhabdus poinarii G6]
MIRVFTKTDMDAVLSIWLEASIQAHHFVPVKFWQSQIKNMRHIYIPASAVYVYVQGLNIVGFYALYENNLAAIFVSPDKQGQGIGKALMDDAKNRREELTLSVYQQNQASYAFYLSQGFSVVSEELDKNTGCPAYLMKFKRPVIC